MEIVIDSGNGAVRGEAALVCVCVCVCFMQRGHRGDGMVRSVLRCSVGRGCLCSGRGMMWVEVRVLG